MFPGLVRLILEKSGRHLNLLWESDETDPKRHLLVLATSELLKQFYHEPVGGQWTATLTRTQVLGVAESVFEEVIDNPYWVKRISNVGGAEDTPVGVCIGAVMASLTKLAPGQINSETVASALKAGLRAGAMELSLLEKIPGAAAGSVGTALTFAFDAIFEGVFGSGSDTRSHWR